MVKIIGKRYAGRVVAIGDQAVQFDADGEAPGPFTARCLEQARKCDDRMDVVGENADEGDAAPVVDAPEAAQAAAEVPPAEDAPKEHAVPHKPRKRRSHPTP